MKSKIKFLFLPFIVLSLFGCAKSTKGNSVTRSVFRDAVDFRYKNLTYLAFNKENGVESNVAEIYFLEDGSMYQAKAEGHDTHYWKHEDNDMFHKIEKKGDFWVVTEIYSKSDYDENDYGDDIGCSDMVLSFKNSYEKLTYSKNSGTYEGSIISDYFGRVDASLKFVGKNLVECKMVGTKEGNDFEYRIEAKDYGKTSIDFSSLNPKNNIYVSGRTFGFVSFEASTFLNKDAINSNNQDSTLKFLENGTFELDMQYDFVTIGAQHTYHGTYTFDESSKIVTVNVQGEGNLQPINGTLSLDENNYESGAILVMNATQLGAKVTFKIK